MDSQFAVNSPLPALPDAGFSLLSQPAAAAFGYPSDLAAAYPPDTAPYRPAVAPYRPAVAAYPPDTAPYPPGAATLGSPFPQYAHVDSLPVQPYVKTFLPLEPVPTAATRTHGISHPQPVYARSATAESPQPRSLTPLGHVSRAATPVGHLSRAATPVGHLSRAATPLGHVSRSVTPVGHVSRAITPVASTPAAASPRRTNARNDDSENTLKRLAATAAALPLADLALKVKMVETGHLALRTDPFLQALALPGKADRAAHVFGMAWLQQATEPAPAAVLPRTRFYARYAEVCADYNLNPVAPATFGRLVHILYPSLKTRRLGGRGKSKYHYCGLGLANAAGFLDPLQAHTPPFSASPGVSPNVVSPALSTTHYTPKTAATATPSALSSGTPSALSSGTPSAMSTATPSAVSTATPSAPPVSPAAWGPGPANAPFRYVPTLFAAIDAVDALAPLALPALYPYLKEEVDCDIVDTLHLLYRVHCGLVFELIRYLKVERLLALFESLPVIMTAPVLKLFTTTQAADWVRDCDLVTYRAVVKMLARLQLQKVSPDIMAPLKSLTSEYVPHMSAALQYKLPPLFVEMKLKAARRFVTLVKCLVRCIETGSATAEILSNASDRKAMLDDWLHLDMNDLVLRELPCALRNSATLSEILEKTFLGFLDAELRDPPLPRFASFLFGLPARFPDTSAWLFSVVLSNFLTVCLREMLLAGANSFGRWWIVRCWVDEYYSWCFQLGGFLYDDSIETEVCVAEDAAHKENSFIDLMEGIYGDKMENWA